jgi:hypothetical protein
MTEKMLELVRSGQSCWSLDVDGGLEWVLFVACVHLLVTACLRHSTYNSMSLEQPQLYFVVREKKQEKESLDQIVENGMENSASEC